MLDLYCWISLLCELCLDESTLSQSVAAVKDSVKHLEIQISSAKQRLGRLASNLKADCTEIFSCEDCLESLMVKLKLERRRMLSACADLTTTKLAEITEEVGSDPMKISAQEVRRVALFCKKLLKAIQTELPTQLLEVDIAAFTRLKAACVQLLRGVVEIVQKNTTEREKHTRIDENQEAAKIPKLSEHLLS